MKPIDEARQRMDLRGLMLRYGHDPKPQMTCPFCGKKSAGYFEKGGPGRFKCFHSECRTGGMVMDEVRYVAAWEGLSHDAGGAAYQRYLELAGVRRMENEGVRIKMGEGKKGNGERDKVEGRGGEDFSVGESTASEFPIHNEHPVEGISPEADVPPSAGTSAIAPGTPGINGDTGAIPQNTAEAASEGEPSAKVESVEQEHADPEREDDEGDLSGWDDGVDEEVERVLLEFWEATELTDDDAEALWNNRGLTTDTVEWLGFRSGRRDNEERLREIGRHHDEAALLASGMFYKNEGSSGVTPNLQFCGWGICRRRREDGRVERAWTYPILIPYWQWESNWTSEMAVITEGEFKAAALWQVFRSGDRREEWGRRRLLGIRPHKDYVSGGKPRVYCPGPGGLAVFALPGIQMAKHAPVMWPLRRALRAVRCKGVSVVFDNEEKGDSRLLGFQANPMKRFDSEIWARYLAIALKHQVECRVGHLPKEWRDEKGKADWDGSLALLLRRNGAISEPELKETK